MPSSGQTTQKGLRTEYLALFLALAIMVLTGCVPSLQYRLGQGFYSDTYAKTQVQAAANAGRLRNLGRFSNDYFACFNYSQDLTDAHIVLPAIKERLGALGGNAADNVVANAPWYQFVNVVLFPFACTTYTVSGEALLVEPMVRRGAPFIPATMK